MTFTITIAWSTVWLAAVAVAIACFFYGFIRPDILGYRTRLTDWMCFGGMAFVFGSAMVLLLFGKTLGL